MQDNQLPDVRFIQAKSIDFCRLEELMAASARANHWANFGPVGGMLEAHLEAMFELPPDRRVALACSATAALFALAGVHARRLGRPLRWVGSAYAFRATRIGPMEHTRIVDCTEDGFLDLEAVEQLPHDSWDGLIVTNLFGARADLSDYVDFCRERGKAIIADNALAAIGFDRREVGAADEVISFHHTKPWGFGEGGCAILPADDVHLFRTLLTFGHQAPPGLEAYSLNGKLSDLGAAGILQWLQRGGEWMPGYESECARVSGIAEAAGFTVFARPPPGELFGFAPVLAPAPVPIDLLRTSALPLARYYPPLADLPNTMAIHRRMVCVPCHPDMSVVSEDAIEAQLSLLLRRAMAA